MATPPPPDVILLVGPVLLGCFFGWGLFGILCFQAFLYYRWYPKDSVFLKLFVASLIVLEIADTVVASWVCWSFMVTGWGDFSALIATSWEFCVAVILTGIIALAVQVFFARRLWVLSHSISIVIFVILLALLQCACSIVGSAQVLSTKIMGRSKLSIFNAFLIWLCASAACDIVIAGGMFYFLYKTKQMSLLKSTDYVIVRLISYSMQTGAVTAACAILNIGFFLGFKTNNLQDIPFLMLARLYSNAVLANLNARSSLRQDEMSNDIQLTETTAEIRWKKNQKGSENSNDQSTERQIDSTGVSSTLDSKVGPLLKEPI